MKIIARHKWVADATITESYDPNKDGYRRFTATIHGWRGFKIFEGYIIDNDHLTSAIVKQVKSISERIKAGDDSVFHEDTRIEPTRGA